MKDGRLAPAAASAVFGPAAVHNREYVGIGLSFMDGGMTPVELASLAMSVTGRSKPADVVGLLWTNVVGSAPTQQQAQLYIDLLTSGSISTGQLTLLAADTSINTTNIDLVGLARTGLEFVSIEG